MFKKKYPPSASKRLHPSETAASLPSSGNTLAKVFILNIKQYYWLFLLSLTLLEAYLSSVVVSNDLAVLCGTPPAVENAHLIGRRRSHYDIHSVVRYQCSEGFFQRHIPTVRCRADGSWERPRIICTKCKWATSQLLFRGLMKNCSSVCSVQSSFIVLQNV